MVKAGGIFVCIILILSMAFLVQGKMNRSEKTDQVSGEVVDGLRLLKVDPHQETQNYTVYRGDYIKFKIEASMGEPTLAIPSLSISKKLENESGNKLYFKMKKVGQYPYILGNIAGTISVIEYEQSHYTEVTPEEAAKLISDSKPLVLDVRTPMEFQRGHLEGALLIPVQQLDKRLSELSDHQEREILLYCATGNRSTVASKILNDNGFKRIFNLRHGIVRWAKEKYPIVR